MIRTDAGPQPVAVAVHDRTAWLGRGMYYDMLALTVLLLAAFALGLDLYRAGYLRAVVGPAPEASFRLLGRLALEAAAFVGAFAWICARLVRAAYRELPRVG